MSIPDLDLIACQTCSKTYRYPQERRGRLSKAVRCGACKSLIEVPPKADPAQGQTGGDLSLVKPRESPLVSSDQVAKPAAVPAPGGPTKTVQQDSQEKDPVLKTSTPAGLEGNETPKHLIIVEPDEVRSDLLDQAAILIGATSHRCTTLADAFVLILEKNPGLLVTTVVLDDGLCQDLISQARDMAPDLKVILAGSIFRSYRFRSSPTSFYGADNYFEGPTTAEELKVLFLDTIPAWRVTSSKHDALGQNVPNVNTPTDPTPAVSDSAPIAPEPSPEGLDLGPIRPPHPNSEGEDVDLWGDDNEDETKPPEANVATAEDQNNLLEVAPPAPDSSPAKGSSMPKGSDGPDRLARVVLSDLLLYHRDVVKPGMSFEDFESQLKEPLEEARSYLENRYPGKGDVLNCAIQYFLEHPQEFDIGTGGSP